MSFPIRALIAAAFAVAAGPGLAGGAAPAAGAAVEARGPGGPLKGTLLAAPAKGGPVALIIPGSGPTDRDGNSPLGIRAQSYKLLAEALAERGVTSARIDKRGLFGSAAAVADANAVTIGAYADDVHSWVRALTTRTGAPCIWLVGHSEGGLVALAAAARSSKGVCGLVLVAAPGRKLAETLRGQLRANPANAPLLGQAEAAIASLEAGKPVDASALHPALLPLFAPPIQPYLIDLFSHDPAALAAKVRRPLAVVQGERDLQVTAEDARRLAGAAKGAKLVFLPGVNHVLKAVASDDRAANAATYADPALPLAPGVADAVAGFILAHRGGAR